ncbi:hypothetical protein SDC9_75105 [bioreactor metagenome]|uniref:Uncharacterized protein n=1 Tax=bioreactor metagenome TaxID=1076179 RepID=A0A644YJS1_9ZZZZ
MDDFDHLLRRRQTFEHLGPTGPFGHFGDKSLDHLDIDIGPEQHKAYLAHGLLDIGLGQLALAAQLFKGCRQALRQGFKEHWPWSSLSLWLLRCPAPSGLPAERLHCAAHTPRALRRSPPPHQWPTQDS